MRFLTASVCALALTAGSLLPAAAQSLQDAQPDSSVGAQSSFEVASSGVPSVNSGSFEIAGTAVAGPANSAKSRAANGASPTFGADFSMWNTAAPNVPTTAHAVVHPAVVAKMPAHVAASVAPVAVVASAAATTSTQAAPSLGRLASGLFARTQMLASRLTSSAMHFVGTPYVFGGTSVYGFDCSGYVQHVFAMFGISLPRTADAQYLVGHHIAQRQMERGDLVFFQTYTAGVSHVGIYLGNGSFIHSGRGGVQVSSLRENYWAAHYVGATHIIGANAVASARLVN